MSEDNSKVNTFTVYKKSTFLFIYDVRKTNPGQFLDSGIYDESVFRPETGVTVEIQINSCNFKVKNSKKKNLGYSFRLI